ncbi:hypothetical protein ACF1BQ_034995 [Bradyrhizobium sp. RDT10]
MGLDDGSWPSKRQHYNSCVTLLAPVEGYQVRGEAVLSSDNEFEKFIDCDASFSHKPLYVTCLHQLTGVDRFCEDTFIISQPSAFRTLELALLRLLRHLLPDRCR